jgi:DNA-binding response OmpR family regulator
MRQCVVATGRHVLIVEDDHITALVISEYLRAHGYRTSVARNGTEAIEMFWADAPDLALVDVQLPRKDGFQVCYEMRATGLQTMIVLMSAHERNVQQAELFVESFLGDGFLLKPFDLDVLVERVHALVGT